MDKKELLQLLNQHPGLEQTNTILENNNHLVWEGLKGSSLSLMSLLYAKRVSKKAILVVDEKEDGAQLQNELELFSCDGCVYFMPSAFKRSIAHGQPDPESSLLRTEALTNFFNPRFNQMILITYPEALAEKVFLPNELTDNTLSVKVGDKLSTDFIEEVLITYGFERVDFVFQPGQYAMRGGLVDVFSYAADWPYRIDFFGEEVESIRTFDIENQLSKETFETVKIIPDLNDETLFKNRIDLLSLLGNDVVFIAKNVDRVKERIFQTIDLAETKVQELKETFNIDVKDALVEKEKLDFYSDKFQTINVKSSADKTSKSVHFNTSVQPTFNKKFDLIAENLKQNVLSGYKNIIVSTQQNQIDRLSHIFNEIESDVSFSPLIGRLHQGFIDHDLKLACYTDHQIF